MNKPAITHDSFTVTREYPVTPDRVFRAFSDPVIKRRWFAEGEGFIVDSYELDFRVGGGETSAFRVDSPEFSSQEIRNDTRYFDIVEPERIILAYSMSYMGRPFSTSLQSVILEEIAGGTRLTLTEQAAFLDGSDGVELRRQGTEALLESLARELGPVANPA